MNALKSLVSKLTGGEEKQDREQEDSTEEQAEEPEDHSHDSKEEEEACQFC
jgi:hypothetical protein